MVPMKVKGDGKALLSFDLPSAWHLHSLIHQVPGTFTEQGIAGSRDNECPRDLRSR